MPFSWFLEEVANARREADKDLLKKQQGNVAKSKGNSYYGKMIEDLRRHKKEKFTREEWIADKALRSPLFDNLEEIGGAYEVKKLKRTVMIKRPYQCGIAVYQLAKLQMLEFYYDFLNKYFSRKDFQLCYMDRDSFYLAISGNSLDEIVKPEMKQAYEADMKNWLATDKFSERICRLNLRLNLSAQGACGLLQSATLFKMRHSMKIKNFAKAFQRSIMICIFSAMKMPWMFL